jgi:hypothetical protein
MMDDEGFVEYTKDDIRLNRKSAHFWGITKPGWYSILGPDGGEVISGPFSSREEAVQKGTRWGEKS